MPSVTRPKPSFPNGPEPNKLWIEWIDRQVAGVLGATYATINDRLVDLGAAITSVITASITALQAEVDAVETDVTALETSVTALVTEAADHETRIDDLEADSAASKTTPFAASTNQLGTTASTTYYHHVDGFFFSNSPVTTIDDRQMLWPRAGTIRNLRYQNLDPKIDADTYSWTLNKNGSDTALTVTGISPGSGAVFSDTTHSVTVAVNDLLVFTQANGGAGLTGNCNPSWTFDFEEA